MMALKKLLAKYDSDFLRWELNYENKEDIENIEIGN
jgi:hypothetical protein